MRIERDQIKTLVVLAGLTAAFVAGLWLPQHRAQVQIQRRIDDAQRQLSLDPVGPKRLSELADEVAHLQKSTTESSQYVPRESELADLLRDLSRQLEVQKAVNQEIQTQPIVTTADYSVIPVKLAFGGSFRGAYDLVRHIESSRRLIRLDRLEIKGDPTRSGEPLQTQIELSTFFMPVAVPAPADTEVTQP